MSLSRDILTENLAPDISPFGAQQGRRAFLGSLQMFRTGRVYLHHVMGKHRVEVSGDRAALQVYRLIPFVVTRELLDREIFGALYDCELRVAKTVCGSLNPSPTPRGTCSKFLDRVHHRKSLENKGLLCGGLPELAASAARDQGVPHKSKEYDDADCGPAGQCQ